MKESALELRDTKLAALLGWHKEKGTSDGAGDSLYVKQGFGFYVERKKPGKKQQQNQKDFEKFITEVNGTPYYLLDSKNLDGMRDILVLEEARLERFNNAFAAMYRE